jgi:hypothetical protein
MKACFRVAALAVAAAVVLTTTATPTRAKAGDFLMSKKLIGIVGVGASGFLFKAAYDSRKDANDLYDQYKAAGSAQSAQEYYDESKRKDTRGAVMLGAGAITFFYSLHLILSGDKEDLPPPPKMDKGLVGVKGVAVNVSGDPLRRGMTVRLQKGF